LCHRRHFFGSVHRAERGADAAGGGIAVLWRAFRLLTVELA
jgi:hypothetical protein